MWMHMNCEHNCLIIFKICNFNFIDISNSISLKWNWNSYLKICNAISSDFGKIGCDKIVHIKIKSKRKGNRKDYD